MKSIMSTSIVMMIVVLGAVSASEDASPICPTTLYVCVAAPNCEVFNSTHGTMLRLIPGMEPGSADYQSRFAADKTSGSRRSSSVINPFISFAQASMSSIDTAADSCSTETCSHVSLDDTRLNYGSTNPADAIHHLWDMCHEGSCDSTAYSVDISVIGRVGPNTTPLARTLSLLAQGQYNGWDERAKFVSAVVAVASQDQKRTEASWHHTGGIHGEDDFDGTLWQGHQTSFIGVNRFVNGNLQVSCKCRW